LRLSGGFATRLDDEPPITGRNPTQPPQPSNGSGITDRGNYDALGRRYFVGIAMDF
jgi:hypothetical protein